MIYPPCYSALHSHNTSVLSVVILHLRFNTNLALFFACMVPWIHNKIKCYMGIIRNFGSYSVYNRCKNGTLYLFFLIIGVELLTSSCKTQPKGLAKKLCYGDVKQTDLLDSAKHQVVTRPANASTSIQSSAITTTTSSSTESASTSIQSSAIVTTPSSSIELPYSHLL